MTPDNRKQFGIAAILALLVATTHGHHFASTLHLPPATWAVFFMAGFYVRRARLFAALLAEVVLIDCVAVTAGGVSAFCLSPAYGFLLPAYGALWLAGRWYATRYRFVWNTLPALGASLLSGVVLAEIFSSGGFYFFSGRFADTNLAEFGNRLLMFFPYSLQSFAFWTGVAIVVHVVMALSQSGRQHHA
ncbi:MAG TPA: hypothetical protein PKW44_05840 [Methylophilaceae bacterium]|nr:hypothetical protein [Methylophilaceae bacterium]